MLHIKLKGMKLTITCKQIVCPFQAPSTPGVGFSGQNICSFDITCIAY